MKKTAPKKVLSIESIKIFTLQAAAALAYEVRIDPNTHGRAESLIESRAHFVYIAL
jgi:hypothetical protein